MSDIVFLLNVGRGYRCSIDMRSQLNQLKRKGSCNSEGRKSESGDHDNPFISYNKFSSPTN